MTKIISSPTCGNSPKMEFLKKFNIAFAEGNVDFLSECVVEDIVWNIVGDRKIDGIDKFMEELEKMKSKKVTELIINQILSHGKEGASNGIMKMQNGKQYAFSDFYVFKNTKSTVLKSITSYVIEI
ncbi:nuclear transport factor 2 family protein [Belliella kenyensis]|uniref:Nuclear transport factor 2 family protein n=1 Tax=Belliella kenyensis TaxID=1472724 RepID=A0ABV8EMJ3_9BACT|nr:nuclear transport factor 2 family protein [Belliella kenyensis]MCH7403345.1 nuclear transport factor 2 family protein [Belliella kenyensis]MDN3602986.1 nuclear transport factor 2 family protein [Belliella kenyensis]